MWCNLELTHLSQEVPPKSMSTKSMRVLVSIPPADYELLRRGIEEYLTPQTPLVLLEELLVG